jgi:hypothetical protein
MTKASAHLMYKHYNFKMDLKSKRIFKNTGVFGSCADILTTSYWLHVELGKNI